jgi:pyruvate dehydrogenase E1 component
MSLQSIINIRDRWQLPVTDKEIEGLPYLKFAEDSEEYKYMLERRTALGEWFSPG